MKRAATAFALLAAASSRGPLAGPAVRPADDPLAGLLTAAEASGHARTSSCAEVEAFLARCAAASTRMSLGTIATTEKGRDVPIMLVADPPLHSLAAAAASGRLNVLVFANIHGGEVEGKEAVQALLREFAGNAHPDLLEQLAVAFVPNLNPDGNDAIDRRNRPDQNGPVEGVGQRANGTGLDLNRDYMKLASPEVRGLVTAVRTMDAALVIDLHTTDGSFHGYELTYAAPLHPASDPALLRFAAQEFLPALRRAMEERSFATFDYGDFADAQAPEKGWYTFDCRPRFGTNYFGVANRLTLLSEAYSHEPFAVRIAATREFVLAALRFAAAHAVRLRELRAGADAAAARLAGESAQVPLRGRIERTRAAEPVLVGDCRSEKDEVTGLERVIDLGVARPVAMDVHVSFAGCDPAALPRHGYAIRGASLTIEELLRFHGIAFLRLAETRRAKGDRFRIDERRVAARPFQGRRSVELAGEMEPWAGDLPVGTLLVPSAQPLARLALLLLDPRGDDGLAAWDLIDALPDEPDHFAVLSIAALD
jgi:hypothetical protein